MNPQLAGGLLAGAGNFLGAGIGAIAGGIEGIRNREHDKEMAVLNQQYNLQNMAKEHEYNLETMAQQNQYQIDQWNRENEYNNPSAVAARYREAGINPRAAFGQGSASGAGIAGGLSSAPSGGAPSGSGQMGSAHPNTAVSQALSRMDIGGALSAGITAMTNAKHTQAETEGVLIENRHKETGILLDLEQKRANLIKTGADTEHQRKSIDFLDQQISESRKRIESIDQQIAESGQRIKQSNSEIRYTEQKTKAERLRNEFYEKYGFFPNQSWITSLLTISNHQIEKVVDKFSEGNSDKSDTSIPKLGGLIPSFLDSDSGQKFVNFLRNAPDMVKASFQNWVNRGGKLTPKSIKRWFNAVSQSDEFKRVLHEKRIPLKQIIWSLSE